MRGVSSVRGLPGGSPGHCIIGCPRAAAPAADVPLETLTRKELYQMAQDLDLPQRKNMSKQQLIDGLRELRASSAS